MIAQIYESMELVGELNLSTLEVKGKGKELLDMINSNELVYVGDKKPLTLKDAKLGEKLQNMFDNPYYLVIMRE